MVYDRLEPILEALATSSIVLTPHLTAPLTDQKYPGELDIMRAGAYNLGFIAVRNLDQTAAFFHWWKEKLYNDCAVDIAANLFVDQRWIDLVPGLFADVAILRDPGLNVAYWNLAHRHLHPVAGSTDQPSLCVNGQPLRFFHFSGFDPLNPQEFSRYQDRYRLDDLDAVRDLILDYARRLLENGYQECKSWPYAYARFSAGASVPDVCRQMVRQDLALQAELEGAFDPTSDRRIITYCNASYDGATDRVLISRLAQYIYKIRPDVRAAFPHLEGQDRLAMADWFTQDGARDFKLANIFVEPVAHSITTYYASETAHNYEQRYQQAQEQIQRLETNLAQMRSSLSWRAGEPLRRTRQAVSNLVQKLCGTTR